MSRDKVPTVGTLDKPEDLRELLKQDRGDDCLPCRVVGGGAFIGLAAYSYYTGQRELEKNQARIIASKSILGMRSRRFGIAATSLGLAWLGVWRLFL
ncbi:uncharacterized protein F4812DRAFT_428485 [Daldinia caldariorum]|uniref:uncharacterized protein n=1 Tax=Daldinia caldariorum TaxID=326644 RepID=UPI002007B0A1|nr:uncharacterized protein F4812DRAFT_428485 [Daldinia caldariorum]KAI1468004.1 hypothetical protein F4812DRAFT_428485 [Daldinia caldariorum]